MVASVESFEASALLGCFRVELDKETGSTLQIYCSVRLIGRQSNHRSHFHPVVEHPEGLDSRIGCIQAGAALPPEVLAHRGLEERPSGWCGCRMRPNLVI